MVLTYGGNSLNKWSIEYCVLIEQAVFGDFSLILQLKNFNIVCPFYYYTTSVDIDANDAHINKTYLLSSRDSIPL
jgi:hypothetical protein